MPTTIWELRCNQTGRPQEAIEQYKQTIRLKPDAFEAHYNLAMIYASMHQSSEAVAAAQKSLEIARSQGRTQQAKQIENWLNSYRAGLTDLPDEPSSKK